MLGLIHWTTIQALNVKVIVCLPAVACDNTADISVQGATKAFSIKTPPELGALEYARLVTRIMSSTLV